MSSNSIKSYLERLGKSVSYAAFDVLREQLPVTTSFVQSNTQTVKDVIKSVSETKNTVNRVADALNINYAINAAKKTIRNAKTDIKSGQFYNPERAEQEEMNAMMEMMAKMMGEDVTSMINGEAQQSPDGEDSSSDSPIKGLPTITKGDTVVASVVAGETRRAANSITDTLASMSNASMQHQTSIASVQISQNERQTTLLNTGFSTIAQGLNSIIEFNNKILKVQAENTRQFQEKMVNLTMENNAIFKELIEIQRVLYKPKQKEEEDETKEKSLFDNGFNLKNYLEYIRRNAEKNPFYQMISMAIQSFPMMIQDIVNNPMQFATKKLIEGFISPALKTAMQSFDNTINNAFRTALARIYDFGHDPGSRDSFLGQLARVLGFKQENVKFSSIDTSKYNKGAMSWNGIAQKALVEVIPGHLRRIEGQLTGKGERYFDYQSGKWSSVSKVARKEYEIDIKNTRKATSEIQSQIESALAPFRDQMSKEDTRDLNRSILQLMKGIYDRGYVDYNDIINRPERYGSDERMMQLLLRALNTVDRETILRATGKIAKVKRSKEKMVNGMDMSVQGIHNDIASGAFIGSIGSVNEVNNKTLDRDAKFITSPATNLTNIKDSRGLTLYDYQLMIYRELFAIRKQGLGGGRGRKGKNKSGSYNPYDGFTIQDNLLPSIVNNERNEVNEESSSVNERIRDQQNRATERFRNINRMRASNAGLEMDDTIDFARFRTDDEYANSILAKMDSNKNKIFDTRQRTKEESNKGFLGNILDFVGGGGNEANEGYPEGVDPDASFIEQMAQAGSIGQKMGVISRNLKNIASAPTSILTSVFTTADKFIYDMLFEKNTNIRDEDNKPVKGVFGEMINELKQTFSGFNEWLNDIFKDLSKGDGIAKKIKTFLKDVFNFDIDEKVANLGTRARKFAAPAADVLKMGIKKNFSEIRQAFQDTASDLGFKRRNATEEQPTEEVQEDVTETQPVNENPENKLASGTRNVKRGGLAFISEGEAIIPADLNPWNPDRDKVDRKEQSKNESRMKQRFMSKLDSSLGKYIKGIPQHADGISSYINQYVNKIPKDLLAKILGNISKDPEKIANILKSKYGIEIDPDEIKRYKEEKLEASTTVIDEEFATQVLKSTLLENEPEIRVTGNKAQDKKESEEVKLGRYNRQKGTYNGINQFLLSAFGTDSKMAAGDIAEYTIKHSPELAVGGVGGALIGTILPLGGPLFGAIAGACATLLSRNKAAMEYLFGSEMTDPKTGKVITKEGIIPRKIVNTMQKYMPDMKKYGIVGTLTGLITPFGPLGGLMIGAGASIVKNNEDLKRILFGEETGLLNKDRKQFLKKSLPNIGAGVLATMFMGPFGLLGNAVVGSGLGLLSTTEQFKRIMLGTKDRNGIRRGGIAGAIRRQITEPFKRTMNEIRDNLGSWFRDKILSPIGRGLVPIGKVATSVITWGINGIVKHFRESIGGRFIENLFDFALGRVRNAGGLAKFLTKKVGGLASFGSRMVEKAGDFTKRWGIKHGFGENFSAAERLEVYGRNRMSHSSRAAFDRALVNMNGKELQSNAQLLETIQAIQNGKIDSISEDRVRSEAYSLTKDLNNNDIIGNSRDRKITESDVRKLESKLREVRSDRDLERLVSSIDTDSRYEYIDEQSREKIKEYLLKSGRTILEYRKQVENLKDSRTMAKAKKRLMQNFNQTDEKEFDKYLDDYTKYANRELERADADLKKQLAIDKEKGNVPEDATVENLIQMNDFQKAQLAEQQEMNKNLKTLIEVVLGKRDSVVGEATDVDTLKDQADLDQTSRQLDNQEDYIRKTLDANRDAVKPDVRDLRKRIFDDQKSKDAIKGLSDEKLLNLLGSDKKKRNAGVSYLKSVAKNYDSTLSRIMNADKFLDLSIKGMKRVSELTLRGYEVNENDYKDIEELSDYGYKAIIELAKLGVKIDSYKAIDRYFDNTSNNSEKKKSLEALLDFAGVRLKDGNRIANVLTTSEIADNLADDNVRRLRYNNPQNSYQIGINNAIKLGNVPENLKLKSTADSKNITSRRRSTDVDYDADQAVSNANLVGTIENTAALLDNTVNQIYNVSKSVLKTVLAATGVVNNAATHIPVVKHAARAANSISDAYRDRQERKYEERRANDEDYEGAELLNQMMRDNEEELLNNSKNFNVTSDKFGSMRSRGRTFNSITETREAKQEAEESKQEQSKSTQSSNKQQTTAKSTTKSNEPKTTTIINSGNVNSQDPTVSTKTNIKVDPQEMLNRILSGGFVETYEDPEDKVGTHAGGLLSQFKDFALNGIANSISSGSADRFNNRNNNSGDEVVDETTTATQQAKTEPVNKLEEYNDLREGNSITQANAQGFNLVNNPITQQSSSGGEGGGKSSSSDDTQNVPTGDGDVVQYEKDKYGNLTEKHNKGNVEVRQKQRYKLWLQERSTNALEAIAKGGGYVKDKAVSATKKAAGGLMDVFGGLLSLPKEIIGGIIQMIPFLGPALSLGSSIIGFVGKFIGGKLLDKLANTKVGDKLKSLIGKLTSTRIGTAIAERLGLDSLEDALDTRRADNKTEDGKEPGKDDKTKTDSGKDSTKTDSGDSGENIPDLPTSDDENKKDDKNNKDNKNKDTNKKKGIFARLKDKVSDAKDYLGKKKNNLKERLTKTGNKVSNSTPATATKGLLGVIKRNKRLSLLAAGIGSIAALEGTNYGTFTGEGLTDNALYATGVVEHAFKGNDYGLPDLTAGEQMKADGLVRSGLSPEKVAELIKISRQESGGVGGADHNNLYEEAGETVASPFVKAYDYGKDFVNSEFKGVLNNPLAELAVTHGVARLTKSSAAGSAAGTTLEMINKLSNGELDGKSAWDIIKEGGIDFATNLMLEKGMNYGHDAVLNKLGYKDQLEKDKQDVNRSKNIDPNVADKYKPNISGPNYEGLKDPHDEIKGKINDPVEYAKWRKENESRIKEYEEEKAKRDKEYEDYIKERNKNIRNTNPNNMEGDRRLKEEAPLDKKNLRTRLKDSAKSGVKSIGRGLKNILKTKKGKVGAAALIATPLLTGLLDEDNTAEASVLKSAHAFETKGSIKSNIDEQQFTKDAEASESQDTTSTEQPTEEESSGILDAIRENPVLSSAIGFVGGIKGGEWGGKLGEKLLGSRGKLLGSLLGGTLGGNILDPSNITPEGIIETFVTNKIWDKGTEIIGNIGKKDNEDKSADLPTPDDLPDNNKPTTEDGTKTKTSLKDRFKNVVGGTKGKISEIASGTKQKMETITNTVQNLKMKADTTSTLETLKDVKDEGSLKVQSLVEQLKSGIKSLTGKLSRWISGKNAINAIKNFSAKLIENITKPQNIKKIASKLAKSSLKSMSVAGGPLVFAAVVGVGAISDFIHGYNSADELYGLKPGLATTGMKIVAGFVTALVGIIPFVSILIPEDFVLELAVEYIGPAFGFGKKELEELRKSGDEQNKTEEGEVVEASTFGDDFKSMVANASKGIISKVVATADDAANAIGDISTTIANKVGESASVAKNWVADTAKTVGDWITDNASRGWDYLKDKASSAADTVGEIMDSAGTKVKEGYESVKNTIKDYLPSFGSGKHSMFGMNKFFSQLDPRFAMQYNAKGDSITQTMSDSGCGPAALSNAMSSFGLDVDPRLAAQYALQNGYKETDGGTRPEFFTDMMNKLGTGSSRLHNQGEIMDNLKQGKPVILMGKDGRGETKQNPYAENPHYVTATGIDNKGNIIVQDPESFTPNKVYKASNILNKSTIAIGAGKGKSPIKRLYGRARSIIRRYPRTFYGRSRYPRYGMGEGDMGAQIYEYLHKKIGLSSIATAAIMGNMMAESGLMPNRVQGDGIITADEITVDGSTGYGLCQWTYITRQQGLVDFAAQQGKSTSDYQVQCDYLIHELENSYPGCIEAMDNCGDDVRRAAIVFHDMFEGSADTDEMKARRSDYAEQILANEGKGIVEAGTYSGGSGGSSSGGQQQKKNTGLFGAISNITSILSSALNPFGNSGAGREAPNPLAHVGKGKHSNRFASKYGRFKHFIFGRGDEAATDAEPTDSATDTTNTTANMDAQQVQDAQNAEANTQNQTKAEPTKSTPSTTSSSGGLFGGLEAFAKQVASPISKAMGQFGSALKSSIGSVYGNAVKFFFGDDNPFLSIFGGESSSSSSKPGQSGPGQTMNVKVAGNPVDTLLGSMSGAVVTSDYGAVEGRPTAGAHGGVDIGADEGTPIPSPISGTVVDLGSGWGGGYGNYIQVKDSKGNYHMFAHCASQSVSVGQQVQPGTVLGTVGNTGQSYGAHLHYEIDPPENQGAVKGGATLNPNSYTGAGKHKITSMGMGKLVLPKYGLGLDETLTKASNETFDGLDTLNIESTPEENIEDTTKFELIKPKDEEFRYDGFGTEEVANKYKYGTGWFSDFTKRSINTIKDAFNRWNKKYDDKNETNTTGNTAIPSKQPESVAKESSTENPPIATPAQQQVSTNQNIKQVTDTQKLDAILDAMNENNRLLQQQNQLISSIINIASNYLNSNEKTVSNKQQLTMNTNTRRNNYDPTMVSVKTQLSQFGNGSQFGLGDRFGTRDSDGFTDIIRTMNEIASR